MTNQTRIDLLKQILIDLHHGASPESVQDLFNEHFTGVSALEISMMEHELMGSDTGITFEDVMKLCNVHANLFKGAIANVEVADSEQEGHPVFIFKQENLALRAALLRIRRLFDQFEKHDLDPEISAQILQGLKRQFKLLSQFEHHYTRKEKLFFPIMERYGHDAPPRVMWGVDDDIRNLFKESQLLLNQYHLDGDDIGPIRQAFDQFASEFEEMIFKEESILLMILLETFSQDDWLAIANESDAYGYAIVHPTAKWIPKRQEFLEAATETEEGTENSSSQYQLDTPAGTISISFTPKMKETLVDTQQVQPFGHGYLSLEQANLLLNHLPLELSFVNKDDIFQYYNVSHPSDEMLFKRTPSQVGRHVELCHPPKIVEKFRTIIDLLRTGQRDEVPMWFKKDEATFIYVVYKAVRDQQGEFQGVLEYVQNIQPFFELENEVQRDISEE
ncbi:DUF438 domain-containing protein [Streptococcus sp. NLN76]|uniref:DUF438 domain-containing protein n=1 Tax=Streptococcus sp. NLN76 TaxID=2822800 RepID=UPI0018AC0FE9|nr:DUF438 domain-containing protein [Streptococcus sp. NLN76]MBF8969685.1 DUF438 domain-containing protein [Streptococcus sp. NLN76]